MSENKDIIAQPMQPEEQEVDLIELVKKVWSERKLVFKWCGIAVVVGLIVAFSIPREYETLVTLAPETTGRTSGGMSSLAAMAGITMGTAPGSDALSPELYPDIVRSTPFLIELFDVSVVDKKGEIQTTLFNYLDEHQRSPWWNTIKSAPFRFLGWTLSLFKSKTEREASESGIDPFRLTKKETAVANQIASRINIAVDKKTGVTSLSVMMQDPLISATMTDTIMSRLQMHITNYRTTKARHDFAFAEKLFAEAKANYVVAQERYAIYVDKNTNVVRESSRVEETRLRDEMNLAYSLYTQLTQQLEVARAKVQEITPVYTVVQPATVPLSPIKPRKAMILIGFVFLTGVAAVGWILFIKDFISEWKKPKTS